MEVRLRSDLGMEHSGLWRRRQSNGQDKGSGLKFLLNQEGTTWEDLSLGSNSGVISDLGQLTVLQYSTLLELSPLLWETFPDCADPKFIIQMYVYIHNTKAFQVALW